MEEDEYACMHGIFLTVGRGAQSGFNLQSLYFQRALPWPSKVPPPVMSKPLMCSKENHSGDSYSLISVVAFKSPFTSIIKGDGLLHGP